jgi:hypothetical protein
LNVQKYNGLVQSMESLLNNHHNHIGDREL